MLNAEPARPPQPSLIERSEPPRAVLPRWVHTLLGVRPQPTTPAPDPACEPAEPRAGKGLPPGPAYRCYPR